MLRKGLDKLRHIKKRFLLNKADRKFFFRNGIRRTMVDKLVLLRGDYDIWIRTKGSDKHVYRQVFIYEEYRTVVQAIKANGIKIEYILDLGANIGLSALYLHKSFSSSEIICVEPDVNNYSQLVKNTEKIGNIKPMNAVVWSRRAVLGENVENPFRGGEDWSKSFIERPSDSATVEGLTIPDILEKFNIPHIDLLKMDIEGAERFLFNEESSDLSFLDITSVIAIEIHDEYNIRQSIYNILKQRGFILFESGELTIGMVRSSQ